MPRNVSIFITPVGLLANIRKRIYSSSIDKMPGYAGLFILNIARRIPHGGIDARRMAYAVYGIACATQMAMSEQRTIGLRRISLD
jgi:hypothetical protein